MLIFFLYRNVQSSGDEIPQISAIMGHLLELVYSPLVTDFTMMVKVPVICQ
jgi:acetyl-CoA carboxylase carboxyltransferase component